MTVLDSSPYGARKAPRVPRTVVIVGAGVGGLSLAVALRRMGIEVTVFERRTDPRAIESGGGFILWNNAVKALRQLDLADSVQQAGATLELVEWRTPRGRRLAMWPVSEIGHSVGEPALGVRRMKLQSILVRAVGDGVLQLGAECTGFTQDADGVTVRLADGREQRAEALIAADGINSIVRSQLHGGWTRPRYAGVSQYFGITDLETELASAHTFMELDGRGLRFFIFPVGSGETYWAAATSASRPREGAARPGADEKDRLLDHFRGWAEPVESLIDGTHVGAIYQRDIVDRPPITRWGQGRITLLGDAAHPITPNLGQGACQAIEDAVVLSKSLQSGRNVPEALRAYEASRIARTNSFVRRSRMIGAVGRWRNPLACLARDHLTRVLVPGPALRQHARDMAYQF